MRHIRTITLYSNQNASMTHHKIIEAWFPQSTAETTNKKVSSCKNCVKLGLFFVLRVIPDSFLRVKSTKERIRRKNGKTKVEGGKILALGSISQTFYAQLLCQL